MASFDLEPQIYYVLKRSNLINCIILRPMIKQLSFFSL